MIYEYFETSVLSFYLFYLFIAIGIFLNLRRFNSYNILSSERTVLVALPGHSGPKVLCDTFHSNYHDVGHHNQNVNKNIFHKNPDDFLHILKDLRVKNDEKVIIGSLNINSIPNKIDALKALIPGYIDILIIVETKLDPSFETAQFSLEGFNLPYRVDRNRNGGGILIYIREGIPTRLLNVHNFPNDIEGLFVEINLRKTKWLLCGTYHPPSQNDKYFFDYLGKALDTYSDKYDKFLLTGDFNSEEGEPCLDTFLSDYNVVIETIVMNIIM